MTDNKPKTKRKPVLFAEGQTERRTKEFYERSESRSAAPRGLRRRDRFYIPGYSDERHELEKQRKVPEIEMGVKLKWERYSKLDNSDDAWALMQAEDAGFRFVRGEPTEDGDFHFPDLEAHGYEVPPGARVDKQGLLRIGDTALMINDDAASVRENFEAPIRESKARRSRQPNEAGIDMTVEEEKEVEVDHRRWL